MKNLSDHQTSVHAASAATVTARGVLGRLLCIFLLAGLLGTAGAQGGAALVDPSSKLYEAGTGETLSGSVNISNPSEFPLSLRLYLADWSLDLSGQFVISEVGVEERSASDWVNFESTTLQLAPRETIALPYTVSVPAGAEPGTHWGVLFVESEPSDPQPGQTAASFSVRVGHVIYVNVPGGVSEGSIAGVFGQPPSTPERPYTVIAQYVNTGTAAQSVTGTFTVRDQSGASVIEAAIERSVVLPGGTRAFQINVVGPLPAGNYTALVVLNYGDSERDVAGAHDFTLSEPLIEPSTEPAATNP